MVENFTGSKNDRVIDEAERQFTIETVLPIVNFQTKVLLIPEVENFISSERPCGTVNETERQLPLKLSKRLPVVNR